MCEHTTSRDNVYLPSVLPRSSPSHPHRHCTVCGTVRAVDGKRFGYFLNLLAQLQQQLRERPWIGVHPFTEIEKRLLLTEMENSELFTDPYGSYGALQRREFYKLLKKYRKALTPDILDEILPN